MDSKETIHNLTQPEIISAKLERIARDYHHGVACAIKKHSDNLVDNLEELAEKYGTRAVQDVFDSSEDRLSTYHEPHTSIHEFFSCVPSRTIRKHNGRV